jgi:hypothetical protein
MKKISMILLAMVCIAISANAQGNTTVAKPISNGCGSEASKASQIGASVAKPIDALITGTTIKQQNESCDQHDKDYYNGVSKKTADDNFKKRSPIMGTAVKGAKETSQKSYEDAQKDRKTSERLQSTWEKENQQCLDNSNYRVEKNKTNELLKKSETK